MARGQGARSQMAVAFEPSYGVAPPAGDFWRVPFASTTLGSEQPLLASELLGYGRDPITPVRDAITVDGDVVVPLDTRFLGIWLSALMGLPTTTAFAAATGSVVFSAQPVANATLTVNGTLFTFVTAAPTGNQIQIGANLGATLTNAVTALNASVVPGVAAATYSQTGGTTLVITHDTLGLAGNAFTLATSSTPASNGTLSGPTLSGGRNAHEFRSGSWDLPSLAAEVAFPDVPHFALVTGIRADQIQWTMQRSGLVTATVSCVAQREVVAAASVVGAVTELPLTRFGAFSGGIRRNGTLLANVVSGQIGYMNNLDRVETIRDDGAIDGADPAMAMMQGNIEVRFADQTLLNQAVSGQSCELSFGYDLGPLGSVSVVAHEVFLPRPRIPVQGPGGIQTTFDWQAARDPVLGRMATITLVNDMASYANP